MARGTPLSQLNDIQVPPAVSIWPPAPGWWLAGALALAGVAAGLFWLRRRTRHNAYKRVAWQELARIERKYDSRGDTVELAADLSRLLRRVCLARYPRREVAGLSGKRWLEFLDSVGKSRDFTEGEGAKLAAAPYDTDVELDPDALLSAVKRWIKHQ